MVEVFDCDVLPDGRGFIGMELLEGEHLGEWLHRTGKLAHEPRLAGCLAYAPAVDLPQFFSAPEQRAYSFIMPGVVDFITQSSPSTHRSVQVKGTGINGRAATADDLPLLMRYRQAMEYEICSIGYRLEFLHAMLAFELEDLVAISFTPAQAFDQTPGPKAGSQIVQGAPA